MNATAAFSFCRVPPESVRTGLSSSAASPNASNSSSSSGTASPAQVAQQAHDLPAREVLGEVGLLRHVADRGAIARVVADRDAVHRQRSGVRPGQAEQQLDEGGLPRAVGSQHGSDSPCPHGKVHVPRAPARGRSAC